MIMILSDGSSAVPRLKSQLELRGERYTVYFTNFAAAGKFGRGSVTVGHGSAAQLKSFIGKNRIRAVIDAAASTDISAAAIAVCGDAIPYVKYMEIEDSGGAKLCLSYKQLAEMLRRCGGNALMFAAAAAVSALSAETGDGGERIFVPQLRFGTFDTDTALKYSIPLRNVIEADGVDGVDAVSALVERVGAKMIICDNTVSVSDKVDAGRKRDISVVITHSFGMEYPHTAATAADAVISVRTRLTGGKAKDF